MKWTPREVVLMLFYRLQGVGYEPIAALLNLKLGYLRNIDSLRRKATKLRDANALRGVDVNGLNRDNTVVGNQLLFSSSLD
jgi:hypothetical protein